MTVFVGGPRHGRDVDVAEGPNAAPPSLYRVPGGGGRKVCDYRLAPVRIRLNDMDGSVSEGVYLNHVYLSPDIEVGGPQYQAAILDAVMAVWMRSTGVRTGGERPDDPNPTRVMTTYVATCESCGARRLPVDPHDPGPVPGEPDAPRPGFWTFDSALERAQFMQRHPHPVAWHDQTVED